jgi:uncharacterized membrane protein
VVSFFRSGLVVDCILAFMVLEFMVLILVRIQGARLFRPLELMVSVGAGAALLLALRAALRGARWQGVAIWLLAALGLHVWDLGLRSSMRRAK